MGEGFSAPQNVHATKLETDSKNNVTAAGNSLLDVNMSSLKFTFILLPPKPSASIDELLQSPEGVNQTSEGSQAATEEQKGILSDKEFSILTTQNEQGVEILPAQVSIKLKEPCICSLESGSLKVSNEDEQLHMENLGRDDMLRTGFSQWDIPVSSDLSEIVLTTPTSLIFTEFSSASSLDTVRETSRQADVGENSSYEIVEQGQQRVNYTNAAQGGEYLSSGSEKFSALEQEVQSISEAVFSIISQSVDRAFEMVPKLIQKFSNENTNADFEPVIHRQFSYELAEALKQKHKPKEDYFDYRKFGKPPWKRQNLMC